MRTTGIKYCITQNTTSSYLAWLNILAVNKRLLTDIQNIMGEDYDEQYAYNLIDQVKQYDPTGTSYNHWLIVQVLKYGLDLDEQGDTLTKYLDYFNTIKDIPGVLPSKDIQQYTWQDLIETMKNIDYTSNKQQWLNLVDQGTRELAYNIETNLNECKILELSNKEALMEFSRGTSLDTNNPRIAEEWIDKGSYYGFVFPSTNVKFLWDPYESKLLNQNNETVNIDKSIDFDNLSNLDTQDLYVDDIKILLSNVFDIKIGGTKEVGKEEGYEVKYQDNTYEVRYYLDVEALFRDSQGTKWCTGKQRDYAEKYIGEGMYIVFEQGNPVLAYVKAVDTLYNSEGNTIDFDNEELKGAIDALLKAIPSIKSNKDLINAVKNNDLQGVKEALDNGADIHADDNAALRLAASEGHLPVVEYLVEQGANVYAYYDSALRMAARKGHLPVVEYLIEHDADIHAGNDSALRYAAENGHLPVVEYLVEHGANIHAKDDEALRWAAENGRFPVVEYLVEHDADIHARNDYALRYAAENGHLPVVEYLVEHDADIHADDDHALRWAVLREHLPVVEYLVEHDANIHANDDEALRWAAEYGHLPVVEYLVEHDANIHAQNDYALGAAAAKGHLPVVEYLVEHDANIHASNDYALRWAARRGHLPVVEYLVEHGADIHACYGEALRMAARRGHLTVVEYLKEQYRKQNIPLPGIYTSSKLTRIYYIYDE
jgi:ankyrin repeat protein